MNIKSDEKPKHNIRLFLDLEMTIIDCWENFLILSNHEDIANTIKSFGVDTIGIFSYAIWDDVDVARFNKVMKEPLEEVLDVKITSVKTREDFRVMAQKRLMRNIDITDFSTFIKKTLAFKYSPNMRAREMMCLY